MTLLVLSTPDSLANAASTLLLLILTFRPVLDQRWCKGTYIYADLPVNASGTGFALSEVNAFRDISDHLYSVQ